VIESLRIEQLALVEELELAFGSGLNAVTGETGAGKSIVLGALSLLAGARAQSSAVREGADEAVVEAVFRIEDIPELGSALEQRGLEAEDGALIVRRSVSRGGRSRAWVAGRLVPVSTLSELFDGRIEISSQHESQGLLRGPVQGRSLDAFGDLLGLRARVEQGVAALRAREEEIAELRSRAEDRARREDFLAFQVGEIDGACLDEGEERDIAAEHGRLVHAERLRGDADAAARLLAGDPALSDAEGAADLVTRAARSIRALAELDPELGDLSARLDGAAAEVSDAGAELERYAVRVEADPARLSQLEERIEQLDRLRRKYGGSVQEILAFREQAAAELATLGSSDDRLHKLEAERQAEFESVGRDALELGKRRARSARKLARAVTEELQGLAMPDACFQVELVPVEPVPGAPCAASGAEAAEFLFSANPGESPKPLRRVASGGELSRVFLALKNVLRAAGRGMVLVFDEVDAGVAGRVAQRVGSVLSGLAADHQVLCITHLPQIAAQADTHFQVRKQADKGEKRGAARRTRTEVALLDEAGRVDEIARMAGGEEVGEATRRHARELLQGKERGSRRGGPRGS
jgi:DNA repair protein RecN (Recombination protein N)